METIFAEMESADFYPEDLEDNLIRITCTAPGNTHINAGKVVIVSLERYNELVAIATDKALKG